MCVYDLRHRAYKSLFEGEIAGSPGQHEGVVMHPVLVNPHPISPFSGTMEPISLDKFKDHVERMHSNDDYLFSEEYNVCLSFPTPYLPHYSLYLYLCRVSNRITRLPRSPATCPATFQRTDTPTFLHVSPSLASEKYSLFCSNICCRRSLSCQVE